MSGISSKTKPSDGVISLSSFQTSTIVGREILIFSEQFPGQPLTSRVVHASGTTISIDRQGSLGRVDSLVNNQHLVIQFEYKDQRVTVNAVLKRTSGGKCSLRLGDAVVPLVRRQYKRASLVRLVRLAVLPVNTFRPDRLSTLRWIESDTLNISGGGVLVDLTSRLERETCVLMNIELSEYNFPSLLCGQVRHCYQGENNHFMIGIEFVVKEEAQKLFSRSIISRLPQVALRYTAARRAEMNARLLAWMREQNSNQDQGEENEER